MSNSNQTFRGKVSQEQAGDAYFLDLIGTTNPGNTDTIHTEIVGSGFKYALLKLSASCRHETVVKVLLNGDAIGSLRTGPGNVNAEFSWAPFREAVTADELKIELESMSGKPISNYEIFLMSRNIAT